MAALVSWLHVFISLVLLLVLGELLLPEGAMRPYVRVILGLVLVIAVLRPLVELGSAQWRLPALTLPAAVEEGPLATGRRLAGALEARAHQVAEEQVALQARRLVELRVGVRPRQVAVRLSPEGWVEAIEVVLGSGVEGEGVSETGWSVPPAASRGGAGRREEGPVAPVTVPAVQVGPADAPEPGPEAVSAPAAPAVQAVLAAFYQIPLERIQVRP